MYPKGISRAWNDAYTISKINAFELIGFEYDKENLEEVITRFREVISSENIDGVVSLLSTLSKELRSVFHHLPIVFIERELSYDSSFILFKFIDAQRKDRGLDIVNIIHITKNRSAIDLEHLRASFGINYSEVYPSEVDGNEEFWINLKKVGCDYLLCSYKYFNKAKQYDIFPFFFDDIISFTNLKKGFSTLLEILETTSFNMRQSRLLKTMVDYAFEMMLLVDCQGKVVLMNDSAKAVFEKNGIQFYEGIELTTMIPDFIPELLEKIKWTKEKVYGYRLSIGSQVYVLNAIPTQAYKTSNCYILYMHQELSSNIEESHFITNSSDRILTAKFVFDDILGESDNILEAKFQAKSYANYDSNVLLMGESGCGKELFAQSIHNESVRKNGPFVVLNCGAIPLNLLESELFGYEYGAFTGASKEGKKGAFDLANGGTIFLDEISTLELSGQTKLLRVLEERKIVRVGGTRYIPIDVRVITATNDNLYELVQSGKFRKDLYYRLNVLSVVIPPVRTRDRDSYILFRSFVGHYSSKYSKNIHLDSKCEDIICSLRWEGNVRQIKNFAEKIVIIAPDIDVSSDFLKRQYEMTSGSARLGILTSESFNSRYMDDNPILQDERQRILCALKNGKGNKRLAADMLGISYTTLWRKIKNNDIFLEYK